MACIGTHEIFIHSGKKCKTEERNEREILDELLVSEILRKTRSQLPSCTWKFMVLTQQSQDSTQDGEDKTTLPGLGAGHHMAIAVTHFGPDHG